MAIVGYPEWIFSYRCGLLADLAASTERTFGAQLQRVMDYPSERQRMHACMGGWVLKYSRTFIPVV